MLAFVARMLQDSSLPSPFHFPVYKRLTQLGAHFLGAR